MHASMAGQYRYRWCPCCRSRWAASGRRWHSWRRPACCHTLQSSKILQLLHVMQSLGIVRSALTVGPVGRECGGRVGHRRLVAHIHLRAPQIGQLRGSQRGQTKWADTHPCASALAEQRALGPRACVRAHEQLLPGANDRLGGQHDRQGHRGRRRCAGVNVHHERACPASRLGAMDFTAAQVQRARAGAHPRAGSRSLPGGAWQSACHRVCCTRGSCKADSAQSQTDAVCRTSLHTSGRAVLTLRSTGSAQAPGRQAAPGQGTGSKQDTSAGQRHMLFRSRSSWPSAGVCQYTLQRLTKVSVAVLQRAGSH